MSERCPHRDLSTACYRLPRIPDCIISLDYSPPLLYPEAMDSHTGSKTSSQPPFTDPIQLRIPALSLINGSHPGILSTIDERGYPSSRWMATLSADDFPLFYTLTSPQSHKLVHLTKHPQVSWFFFNEDRTLTVSLKGQARILEDIPTLKRIWKHVQDKSLAYFLKQYSEGIGFVAIETQVQDAECSSPGANLRLHLDLNEVATHSRSRSSL